MKTPPSMRHIRVRADIKAQATQTFPPEIKVPNAETCSAMEESRAMMAMRHTRFAFPDELFADLEKEQPPVNAQ